MDNNTYKYFAFISYSSADVRWGKWLQRRLESFKLPAAVSRTRGLGPHPIRPVFFAPTDIQPNALSAELEGRLRASRYLVVICSPNSARSKWVGAEIEYFHSLGRTADILFLIVDGTPNSGDAATECFNPVVAKLGIPEILAANIHERVFKSARLNRERAYIQLVSKMLGLEFDDLWQRHRRQMRRRVALRAALALFAAAAVACGVAISLPTDISVKLNDISEPTPGLPPRGTTAVTLILPQEVKSDSTTADVATLPDVARRLLGQRVRLVIEADGYRTIDTIVPLSREIDVAIMRDPSVYGLAHFRMWNFTTGQPAAGIAVNVGGIDAVSDADGYVDVSIPAELQHTSLRIKSEHLLTADSIFLPTGPDDVVGVTVTGY